MKYFFLVLVLICVALPALGSTRLISVLGRYPLFPKTESRREFLSVMHQYPKRERAALELLGVDQTQFERAMRTAKNMVTPAPLDLDIMAYYDHGVHIVRDVAVPARTYLWVVHLRHQTVYVPQICGNIAVVAAAGVESFKGTYHPVARVALPPKIPPGRLPTPGPQVAQASSFETPPPTSHRSKFPWWIFLIPVALIEGSHSSSSTPAPSATSTPTPTPVPTGTPTSVPTKTPTPVPTVTPTHTPCPTPTPKPTPTPCPTKTK